jgi:hypothetical protein
VRDACQEVYHLELWRYTSGCELSEHTEKRHAR